MNNIVEKTKHNWLVLAILILAGEGIFFLPFVLARIFRPTVLKTFEITNLELGICFSIYGFIAVASYFFGGPLADQFSARKMLSLGLWTTGLGGFTLYLFPTLTTMYGVYALWGITTILLFWAPLIKATRLWGGDGFQGRAFGSLESGRGLTAALLGTFSILLFASSHESSASSYLTVLLFTSVAVMVIGALTWFFIPETEDEQYMTRHVHNREQILHLLKNPDVWRLSIIILCAYIGYKITDDYSLFAYDVLGFDETQSAGVSNAALWLRPVFALLAGLMADRFSGRQVLLLGFITMMLAGFLIYNQPAYSTASISLIILGISLIGVYGIRGVYFALFKEAAIKEEATGTAVGIMSVIGYLPDVFMSPLMGYALDTYPGAYGHQVIFLLLFLAACGGFVCALWLRSRENDWF
ncbi:MAG: MFS transporter [Crocinitomicaceae bacterium]|nr:MFS transporter [Crocinitomicaceae bacterium]|tara:strand:+ start:3628 stop:4866 length:1239 start_codon:yes stop_codon:yes gene_type:complete